MGKTEIKGYTIKDYLEWIKNHKYEITGIHKIPRTTICRNGKVVKINELTESETIEVRLAKEILESRNIEKVKIIEKYRYTKIEDVPKEYREMIEIIKSTSVFPMYIEWRKNHFDAETGEYKKPRMAIIRDGKRVRPEEMTFEEKKEAEIAYLWRNQSEERRIIKKYKEKDICEIPENYIEMIEEYRKVDENLQDNEIDEEIARIQWCTQDYIARNSSKIEINREIKKIQANAKSYINKREQDEKER